MPTSYLEFFFTGVHLGVLIICPSDDIMLDFTHQLITYKRIANLSTIDDYNSLNYLHIVKDIICIES